MVSAIPVLVMATEKTTVAPRMSNSSHSMYFVTPVIRQQPKSIISPAAIIVEAIRGIRCSDEMMNISTRMMADVMVFGPNCGTK